MPAVSTPQATWRGGSGTSDPVNLAGTTLCGFFIPAGFSGTTISFTVSDNGQPDGNFLAMIDETGSLVSYAVTAAKYIRVRPADFAGIGCFKIVSGSTEAAGRIVRAATREIL